MKQEEYPKEPPRKYGRITWELESELMVRPTGMERAWNDLSIPQKIIEIEQGNKKFWSFEGYTITDERMGPNA